MPESSQAAVREASLNAVEAKLGLRLPGPFDHVAFVVEACYRVGDEDCAFAAYAYVNYWFSLYVGNNYKYPGKQLLKLPYFIAVNASLLTTDTLIL